MTEQPFSLGVTYWPRPPRAGAAVLCSWATCDHGAVRDELAHVASLGLDTVRLELRWAEAQPGPSRIATAALSGLERGLDAAQAAGLQAVVAILSGTLGGALHLPAWAVGYDDPMQALIQTYLPRPSILAGDSYSNHLPARDLYGDPPMRAAASYLLREVVGNLAAHPAAQAWQLAAGVGRACSEPTAAVVAAWWADLANRARGHGARRLLGVVDGSSLAHHHALRPEHIAAAGGELVLSVAPLPPPRVARPWELGHITLLHAVAAGLLAADGRAGRVVVADLGLATAVEGQQGWVESETYGRGEYAFLASEEAQARLVEEALDGLWRAGAGGVWLAGYRDPALALWSTPPLKRAWPARSWGLVAADGRERPAAAAVRAFSARLRANNLPAPGGPPALPIDPERYWRDPRSALRDMAGGG